MSVYVDANLLIRLYLDFDGSGEAYQWVTRPDIKAVMPIAVTDLLRQEVTNGFQRMVFESRTGGQWRVTQEHAYAAKSSFEADLDAGCFLKRTSLTPINIDAQFDSLVGRHTAKHGFRTYDIMHVASALHLGCTRFLSFDAKAIALAKLEGLLTN
ncbi:MAG: type II toxin-antitoxin system VapC family toxin [Prosthecobacter sp.]|uniref:type II toxin-antitoxin system VapC family toxin n=1 Tax=Prosthecobacter sp. TaxID=1965333 RepID=UPI003900D0A7